MDYLIQPHQLTLVLNKKIILTKFWKNNSTVTLFIKNPMIIFCFNMKSSNFLAMIWKQIIKEQLCDRFFLKKLIVLKMFGVKCKL